MKRKIHIESILKNINRICCAILDWLCSSTYIKQNNISCKKHTSRHDSKLTIVASRTTMMHRSLSKIIDIHRKCHPSYLPFVSSGRNKGSFSKHEHNNCKSAREEFLERTRCSGQSCLNNLATISLQN